MWLLPSAHGVLSAQPDAAGAGEPEAVLGAGRAAPIAAELLKPGPVMAGTHRWARRAKPSRRLTGSCRGNPGGVRVRAEAPDASPGAPADSDSPLYGRCSTQI